MYDLPFSPSAWICFPPRLHSPVIYPDEVYSEGEQCIRKKARIKSNRRNFDGIIIIIIIISIPRKKPRLFGVSVLTIRIACASFISVLKVKGTGTIDLKTSPKCFCS